jgi:hypothetical protein
MFVRVWAFQMLPSLDMFVICCIRPCRLASQWSGKSETTFRDSPISDEPASGCTHWLLHQGAVHSTYRRQSHDMASHRDM